MKISRFASLLLLTCLSLGLPLSPVRGAGLIKPPFVRKWTTLTGDSTVIFAVHGGTVFYQSQDGIGALDLATGRRLWRVLPGQWISSAVLSGQTIYAFSQAEKGNGLFAIDVGTQVMRTVARYESMHAVLNADANQIFLLGDDGVLRAFKQASLAQVWTRRLGKSGTGDQLQVTKDALYVADDDRQYGVDPTDGRLLWQRATQYASLYKSFVHGADVITQIPALQRIDVRSGEVVWKGGDTDGNAQVVADVVISNNNKEFVGRSIANGKILWKRPLPDSDSFSSIESEKPSVSDGTTVWMLRNPLVALTREGREQWSLMDPFVGAPMYADGSRIVTQDHERILCYRHGTLPLLPTTDSKKKLLATTLAAQFELLDVAERNQLEKLVPFSFQPLLARYVEWAKLSALEKEDDPDGQLRYGLITDALPLLMSMARREDTAALMKARSSLKADDDWRAKLEEILQKKGEPVGYIPTLVANLRRTPVKERGYSQALDAVAHSSHPQAVALMLEALNDPRATGAWRTEAFRHLAGTGGAAGVAAVRQHRPMRAPRPPWFGRIDLSKLAKNEIVGLKTDSANRTWMLFHHHALGNSSDLFIAQKLRTGWARPLFTGAWTERTFNHEAPKTFRGIPLARLVADKWIQIFPGDMSIRSDSDKDGLTDIVELRLGSNPHKADTDGDKLADAVDPCPNATPRPLGDTEKIIAACLEARFFESDWFTPAILSVGKVKPFELYGYASTLMWGSPGRASVLSKMYGGGVNFIGFHNPGNEFGGSDNKAMIEFSADHKSAKTTISRYSGGLNGDGIEVSLKKIGDEWFAVDLQMRYVS